MADLKHAREEIDRVDKEMARLYEARMRAVSEVAQYKIEHGMPVYNPEREELIVRRNVEYLENDAYAPGYLAFIRKLMEVSRDYQTGLMQGLRVGYSGVKGAFAEIAAELILPGCSPIPYPDFNAAYEACAMGEVDVCVLPVENSFAGEVGAVTDLMFGGSLSISGMYNLRVSQNLMALPGTRVADIKTVISHPQALSQCADYIKQHGMLPVNAVNTALAAKQVAEEGDPTVAAIASKKTAKLYGLEVIDHDIQESAGNTTRFAVFTGKKMTSAGMGEGLISAFLFTVRNEAGSLAKAVGIIGKHGMNLRCLRSRPMKTLAWQYYFYAEIDGSLESEEGKEMLCELQSACDRLKVAGIYKEQNIG